jgi:hypothetical protein
MHSPLLAIVPTSYPNSSLCTVELLVNPLVHILYLLISIRVGGYKELNLSS